MEGRVMLLKENVQSKPQGWLAMTRIKRPLWAFLVALAILLIPLPALASGALISSDVYTIDREHGVLKGVPAGTSVAALLSHLQSDAGDLKVYDASGNECQSGRAASGMTVKLLLDGVVRDQLVLSISMDVSGDGWVGIEDILYVRASLNQTCTLNAWQLACADANADGLADQEDIKEIRTVIRQGGSTHQISAYGGASIFQVMGPSSLQQGQAGTFKVMATVVDGAAAQAVLSYDRNFFELVSGDPVGQWDTSVNTTTTVTLLTVTLRCKADAGTSSALSLLGCNVARLGEDRPAEPVPCRKQPLTVQSSYTVSFDSQGGSPVASVQAACNTAISAPAEPSRAGYFFGGWYPTLACDTAPVAFPYTVRDHVTFYAKWRASCTVAFNSRQGSPVASKTVPYGSLLTKPANPTRTGYTFCGWYRQAACTTAWNFATDRVTAASTTLYAKWTINTYTVTFKSQGGTAVNPQTIQYNGLVTKPANPTRTGYTFAGWFKQAECTAAWNFTTGRVTANTSIWAKWTPIKYTIAVTASRAAYGTVSGGGSVAYGTSATVKAVPKAGCRFVRWLEGSTAVSLSAEYKFTVRGARTLTAHFAQIGTPALQAAPTGYNSVKLSWPAVAGAKEYEVFRSAYSNGPYSKIAAVTAAGYSNADLITGKTYYYKVRVKCVAGSVTTYGPFSAVRSATPVPATPTGVQAARASATSIKVSWAAVAGRTKYELYRATSKTGTYTKVAETYSTSCTNTGLVTGKTYYYKVRAYRLRGSSSRVYGSFSTVVWVRP